MSDWTEQALLRLRARRFTPSAWWEFTAASLRRAGDLRGDYPRAHRTLLLVAAAGTMVCVSVVLAGRPLLGAVSGVWWLATCLMVDWHLGLLDGRDRLGVATLLTLLRAGAVPALLLLGRGPAEVALFALAGASDTLDGLVARSRGEASRLGFWLDGSVDGLVLGCVAFVALPSWAAAAVICRYVLSWLAIGGSYFLQARRPRFEARVPGRLPGLVVFAGLALALLSVPGAALLAVAGALAGLATVSASVLRAHSYAT